MRMTLRIARFSLIAAALLALVGCVNPIEEGAERARANETRTKAAQLLSAVSEIRIISPEDEPSIVELEDAGYLATSQTHDAWGNGFRLEYAGEQVEVVSAGRDGQLGTRDDIVVENDN